MWVRCGSTDEASRTVRPWPLKRVFDGLEGDMGAADAKKFWR
jgi:hypothetical protein